MKRKTLTYLAYDGTRYKIGESTNPDKRISQLKTGNPDIELVCFGSNISEKDLHKMFQHAKYKNEWFALSKKQVVIVENLISGGKLFVKELASEKKKSLFEESCHKYVINFGKYKGRRLSSMKSIAELNYVKWYIKEVYNKSIAKDRIFRDKAFAWWYNKNN